MIGEKYIMDKAILSFCTGELYWEFARFAPYILWKKLKQYKNQNVKFIIMTDPERFDIYGKYVDIFVPFRISDPIKYRQNCFRLDNLEQEEYLEIINSYKKQFKDRYEVLETIYPKTDRKNFSNKNQFLLEKMIFDYLPRVENSNILNKYINNEKSIIILAPRFRCNMPRNWNNWNELYDLISDNSILMDKYNFVICGNYPDYIPDKKNRFFDINLFKRDRINSSIIGLTIECMNKAILTVGSQSAIPNISLLFGVHALEWGHQKQLHTVNYNIRNTQVTFLEDMNYDIPAKRVYDELLRILKGN